MIFNVTIMMKPLERFHGLKVLGYKPFASSWVFPSLNLGDCFA